MEKKEWDIRIKNGILLFVGTVIIYSQLMINQLTNDYDGIWENSFHNAGAWELSLGRWFWQYISRLRFGTSPDPYTTLITLALMTVGLLLLFELFGIKNRAVILISGLIFISNPAISFELSYRYMSPTFGVAFVLSILAVWCFEKLRNPYLSVLCGALCVAFSMGSYQAYICCTTVTFLTVVLLKLSRNIKWKEILLFCVRSVSGILLGGVSYILIMKVYLKINGLAMSDYQGGSRYSILNSLRCLPVSIQKIYQYFSLYFKGILYKINRMQGKHIFTVMFVLVLAFVIFTIVRLFRKNKVKAVLYGLLVLCYPMAALSVLFITTDAAFALQMACGPALFIAVLLCLPSREMETEQRLLQKVERIFCKVFAVFMAAVLYGSIWQVIIDQNAMYEGRIASQNLVDMAVDKMLQEDMLSSEYRYVFVGTPSSNTLYAIDANYVNANLYALFGAWYLDDNSAKSWRGVVRNLRGLNLDMVSGPEYVALSKSELVKGMPLFPEKGSIVLQDGIVYVKIGNAE